MRIRTEPGARFDLRYETIDLDQPRNGTRNVAMGEIPRHHDEVETKNQNWVAGVDWNLAPAWGLSLTIPYVDRVHHHNHNHHGEVIPESWGFRGLGDVRVQARYEFFASREDPAAPRSAGVTLGVKLPTGRYDVANDEGELAERTLQPGTGTTDLMLQANYLARGRDSGDQAEPDDSGQRMLFLSPGVSWNFAKDAQLYAFVQVPAYQSVNGVQLAADWSALAGVSWRF